jgi:fluoride exporter
VPLCGKTFSGDGVRHNRPPCGADDSYQFSKENSIVLDFLSISLGAIFGANARYLISRLAVRWLGPAFPYGTLVINVTGSLLVGFALIWTSERVLADPRWRLFVVVGFCGAFTTFSSYAFETMAFFEQGRWLLMATNILANNLLCLGAVVAGMALARLL